EEFDRGDQGHVEPRVHQIVGETTGKIQRESSTIAHRVTETLDQRFRVQVGDCTDAKWRHSMLKGYDVATDPALITDARSFRQHTPTVRRKRGTAIAAAIGRRSITNRSRYDPLHR